MSKKNTGLNEDHSCLLCYEHITGRNKCRACEYGKDGNATRFEPMTEKEKLAFEAIS